MRIAFWAALIPAVILIAALLLTRNQKGNTPKDSVDDDVLVQKEAIRTPMK